jgi:hypothetical protein
MKTIEKKKARSTDRAFAFPLSKKEKSGKPPESVVLWRFGDQKRNTPSPSKNFKTKITRKQ